MPLYPARI